MDKWVVLAVRESTRNRIFDQCLPLFLKINPSMQKLERVARTHDFIVNRIIDYYVEDR